MGLSASNVCIGLLSPLPSFLSHAFQKSPFPTRHHQVRAPQASLSSVFDRSRPPFYQQHNRTFKVVVLSEVDRLSRQAQAALRRTMEKYTAACRLILCCNSASRVIEPVRSRCLGIRVAAPSHEEVSK